MNASNCENKAFDLTEALNDLLIESTKTLNELTKLLSEIKAAARKNSFNNEDFENTPSVETGSSLPAMIENTYSIWREDRSPPSAPEFSGTMQEVAREKVNNCKYHSEYHNYEVRDNLNRYCETTYEGDGQYRIQVFERK